MPIIADKELYENVKKESNKIYNKPSAYRSGWIVKTYKQRGGEYINDNKPKNLERWFKEQWGDIGGLDYPVYRPFKRINQDTPLTVNEIDPLQAKEQIKLKQIIKGNKNLPAFKKKGSGVNNFININNVPKNNIIWKWSNPNEVRKKADIYLGKDIPIYLSTNKNKKYMVYSPDGDLIHFGQINFEDHTRHQNDIRRNLYLKRSANIRGYWKNDKYSANNLSRNLLW